MGIGRGIDREVAELMVKSCYHRRISRHALGAVISHYEEGLCALGHFPDVGRAGGTRMAQVSGGEFFQDLMAGTFGVDRTNAILSGLAQSTRSRYESGWKHWEMFTNTQNKSPWITRSGPHWGGNLIDFRMFESKIIGNAAPTISGKVSAIRF